MYLGFPSARLYVRPDHSCLNVISQERLQGHKCRLGPGLAEIELQVIIVVPSSSSLITCVWTDMDGNCNSIGVWTHTTMRQ